MTEPSSEDSFEGFSSRRPALPQTPPSVQKPPTDVGDTPQGTELEPLGSPFTENVGFSIPQPSASGAGRAFGRLPDPTRIPWDTAPPA